MKCLSNAYISLDAFLSEWKNVNYTFVSIQYRRKGEKISALRFMEDEKR
jgi:hypothetical protein